MRGYVDRYDDARPIVQRVFRDGAARVHVFLKEGPRFAELSVRIEWDENKVWLVENHIPLEALAVKGFSPKRPA